MAEPDVGAPIDANGNLTSDGTRSFEWNARNQLVAVTVGTHRSEFVYDGLQRRVRQVEKDNGVTTADTRVLWCETAICEERAADGVTVTRRAFGLGEQINGQARFFTVDHLGSVREVTDTAGTLLARYAFDPWGRRTVTAGADVTTVGFTGHRYAGAAADLWLARYRGFSGSLGRWTSEDPLIGMLREPSLLPLESAPAPVFGGVTLLRAYLYVENAPVNRSDPFGLASRSTRDCSNQSPQCDSTYKPCDQYASANARCFCKCAGNGAWSSMVRCCLFSAYGNGLGNNSAHAVCYAIATHTLGVHTVPVTELNDCFRRCRAQQQAQCSCS